MRVIGQSPIRFIAVSSWQRDMALRSSLLRGKGIDVIPHAFPVELAYTEPRGDATSEKLAFLNSLGNRRLIVMGAARLDDPVKNLPMAVTALNLFRDRYPQEADGCEAVFFGTLRDHDMLNGLKMPYRLPGQLDAGELRQLYSAASVVLSTSHFETMGATLMEGMAGGAIPVTFNQGGQGDIVTHNENGFIADYGSAESIAANLARALPLTGAPFTRTAQHASIASRFSAPAIAGRFLELFDEAIRKA